MKAVFEAFTTIVTLGFISNHILVATLTSRSVLVAAQNNQSPPKIFEAIAICREKLKVDPHFPKIQHSLAQLLDSQIEIPSTTSSSTENDSLNSNNEILSSDLLMEVLQLYYSVGVPSPEVTENRLPPPKIRFESLMRAGTIAKDMLHDLDKAIFFYNLATRLDGLDEQLRLTSLEIILPILLSSAATSSERESADVSFPEISLDGSLENQALYISKHQYYLQLAMELCKFVSEKCPNSFIVDELKAATLRQMKQPILAFESYNLAMMKAKQQYAKSKSDNSANENDSLFALSNLLKTSILIAAAGREFGMLSPDEQLNILREAEDHSLEILHASQNKFDEYVWRSFKDQALDLYNNMGIVEKKRGAFPEAVIFFKKALEIKANDGHTLVQLASIGRNDGEDDILSNVKKLDPGYVSALFDGYSSRFESELVDVLHYRGHILVYDALKSAILKLGKSTSSIQQVIDLGCGTGLLGELVANHMPSVRVFGVDLSQRMVDISRQRKGRNGDIVYASVVLSDATDYLSTMKERSVDCILASDVFIYIGDIEKVLEESARTLVNDGLIGFTVESFDLHRKDDDSRGLKLLPSGRFGHSKEYIYDVAASNGFDVLSWNDCVLRKQGRNDVKGAVVILRKPR
ncbi:hypothetical protein ACHAXS_003137 [Conticribra weissflogii]